MFYVLSGSINRTFVELWCNVLKKMSAANLAAIDF